MLEISDYRAAGMKLLVRLKCTCGGRRILRSPDTQGLYACADCGASAQISELKRDATICWQGLVWEVEAESTKQDPQKAVTNYAVRLTPRANRFTRPYCTLTGYCTELSPTGIVFLARDFQPQYAMGIRNEQRFAVVEFTEPPAGLPAKLYGVLLDLKYRDEELPMAQLRICFQDLPPQDTQAIADHIRHLAASRTTGQVGFVAGEIRREIDKK